MSRFRRGFRCCGQSRSRRFPGIGSNAHTRLLPLVLVYLDQWISQVNDLRRARSPPILLIQNCTQAALINKSL